MSRYATTTSVSVEKSKAEIEAILTRYGANRFMSGWNENSAVLAFEVGGRQVRFVLPLPDKAEKRFHRTPARFKPRSAAEAYTAWEQECRSRWRALALVIKAKLEAVASGITVFEDEFLAHMVIPGTGQTAGEWLRPQIAAAYESGSPPALLPHYRGDA